MNGHGGKREGAGRPRGDIPRIRDYVTPEQREELVADVIKRAKKSDRLASWLGDQIFGKAVQRNEHSGTEGEPLKILFDQVYDTSRQPKEDSQE